MHATYDLNSNGALIIHATPEDREMLRARKEHDPEYEIERDILQALTDGNSDLTTIDAVEIGALTSAPIIGLRDEDGRPLAAWGFMDYAVRMIQDDLIDGGRCVFVGGAVEEC